jgi:hypothetical protein
MEDKLTIEGRLNRMIHFLIMILIGKSIHIFLKYNYFNSYNQKKAFDSRKYK